MSILQNGRKRLNIYGSYVDMVTMDQALNIFDGLIESDGLSLIVTPNSEIVNNAASNPELARALAEADLVIPDGIGLVHASKTLGEPFEERVAGIDFCFNALKHCAASGHSAFFLGAKPGIAEAAAHYITEQIPGLVIAGTRDGYFKPEEESDVVREINDSGASFLCLALGSPKQELFAKRHESDLKAKVAIGVGGSFDVWSGTLKRAPMTYRRLGLEWLYRLFQEPSRFTRMAKIPIFLLKVRLTKNQYK